MKVVLPYKLGSKSAKLLASALRIKQVRPVGSRYNPRRTGLIINWGCGSPETVYHKRYYLNNPDAVKAAANKLTTLRLLEQEGVGVPEWTTSHQEASRWLNEGFTVFVRYTLTGHAGQGIKVYIPEEGIQQPPLPHAPLYTKKVKRKAEYRVHVFKGRIIDFQQKKRKQGVEVDNEVRSHLRGWVFARSGVELPEQVSLASVKAVETLGLDFGAVDVCLATNGQAVVFEVNTAPGLEENGTTLRKYVEALQHV